MRRGEKLVDACMYGWFDWLVDWSAHAYYPSALGSKPRSNPQNTSHQPSRVAAAEAAFNVLLVRIAKEATTRDEKATVDGGNAHAGTNEEDVATAMARLLQADDGNGGAIEAPLLRWAVHRFEGWVGGRLGEIGASEVRSGLAVRVDHPCLARACQQRRQYLCSPVPWSLNKVRKEAYRSHTPLIAHSIVHTGRQFLRLRGGPRHT